MSNSASDPKVEDVLSSVRRLVSNELPRKTRPNVPEGPGALVLTESQRVEAGEGARATSKSLEDRIAELEAAVSGRSDEFEPDGSEDQAQHQPDRIVYTRPPSGEEQRAAHRSTLRLSQIALIDTGPANEDDAGEGDTPEFRHETEVDEAPMAVDVPLVGPTSAEVAAFTNPDDVARSIEARMDSDDEPVEPIAAMGHNLGEAEEVAPSIGDEEFEEALSQAVAASVPGAIETDFAPDPEDMADTLDAVAFASDEIDPDEFAPIESTSEDAVVPMDDVTARDATAEGSIEELEAFDPSPADEGTEDPLVLLDTAPNAASPELPDTAEPFEIESARDTTAEVAQTAAVQDETATDGHHQTEDMSNAVPTAETADAPDTTGGDADLAAAALAALPEDDAMRLMVSRLIREELQGELGERITRNVRKLVRREIKRALSSHDLT